MAGRKAATTQNAAGQVNKCNMYSALVAMHNAGNSKAITDEIASLAGVTSSEFQSWKDDVRKLQAVVWDYVVLKNKARCETVEEKKLHASRELIFPAWKAVLSGGEKRALETQLHVDPFDVEDLIGFCWKFMVAGDIGTIQTKTGETVFRKYVESLIGVIIAKNEILDDQDRDDLTAYYGYLRSIEKCLTRMAEKELEIKNYKAKLAEIKGKEAKFESFLNIMIKEAEAEKAEIQKTKEKAEADRDNIAEKAQAIEARLKRI